MNKVILGLIQYNYLQHYGCNIVVKSPFLASMYALDGMNPARIYPTTLGAEQTLY